MNKIFKLFSKEIDMDKIGFKSILYRLSIKAIHAMSGNTKDAITVKEAIEHNACFRPILSCVQIWNVNFSNDENYCDIRFVLSSDFMIENDRLSSSHSLYNLSWTLSIQKYDYGEDAKGNKIAEEDGVDGWLAKSKINVNYEGIDTEGLESEEFTIAIHNTENC